MITLKTKNKQLTDATIMIVDDEFINMEVVKTFLEDEGYQKFVLVEDSTLAIETLQEKNPDLLLLDLSMPKVSGYDILAELRQSSKFKYLPIIILTASTDSASKIRALDLGATDFLSKPVDASELGLRVRNTLSAKAYQDQLAYFDSLTGLPNRQLFLEHFEKAYREAKRYGDCLALLNIELDHFDKIKDTMEVSAGEEILRQAAGRIEYVTRKSDILGRAGVKEGAVSLFHLESNVFTLLLDRIHNGEFAAVVAERVIQEVRAPFHVQEKDIYLTASIGITSYPSEIEDIRGLMQLASSAKDFAKSKGGDSFQFSSGEINAMYAERFSLESHLRKALEKDEFVLHYQPKVNVMTDAIEGVEALIRWNSSDRGLSQPGRFITMAEETGLIVPMGEWIINQACSDLRDWHQSGRSGMTMAINLSVKQMIDHDFIVMIKRSIENSGVDPRFLTLELTESLLLDDVESKILLLQSLKEIGLKLAVDDFGTGYSSFSYLRKLPVDELKIDRAFIKDLPGNGKDRAIASSTIYLAQSLGLHTVAEGVETQGQLDFLKEEGCNQYQGFLFSEALPEKKLLELLNTGA